MKRSRISYAAAAAILAAAHVSSVLAQSCCLLPPYETTYSAGGVSPLSRFKQNVYDNNNLNWDGVSVREGNGTGGTPFDGCWFPGSMINQQLVVSGGQWLIGGSSAWESQYWGYDNLSWPGAAITYYRTERQARSLPMPCNTQVIQKMEMNCNGSWDAYTQSNVATLWIAMTTVTNCRVDMTSSACNTQNYP